MNSGVATMSRELVLSTVHKYDWVQIGGAVVHPDKGKVFDLSHATNQMKGIKDAYVKIYPTDGYGNEQMLFSIIAQEKIDAILHFTDPRQWGWLYALEHQIRVKIPLMFLDIWDDLPYPMYNRTFYESVDALFAISKQTDNINLWVRGAENCCCVDGWYDKNGKLHPYSENPFPLSKEEFTDILVNISKILLNADDLESDRLIETLFDPRIEKIKTRLISLMFENFTGKLSNDVIKKICDGAWEYAYEQLKKEIPISINRIGSLWEENCKNIQLSIASSNYPTVPISYE